MKNKFIIVFSLFCLLVACSVRKSDTSLKNSVTELKGTTWNGHESGKTFELFFRPDDSILKATVQVTPNYDRSDFLAQNISGTTVVLSGAVGAESDKVIMNLTGPNMATATFTLALYNNNPTKDGQSQQTFHNVQLTKLQK